ncbi:MAG TPA: hypothetical protein IAA07_02490 [Candidatus Lachnoclostridium stercoravium]|uniref:Transporter n=1 Tax=Candidatus Lachnoclostridium stercoravium TaxID=2838633 RepID=A0A9D2KLM1_9FIRM|nr:hypothetical protein [Candidatus Lachnoclostridium stercoravium]
MKPSHPNLQKLQHTISFIAGCFEVLVAAILIVGLLITLTHVPEQMAELFQKDEFNNFLSSIFEIIIGIELLKMFCRHNLDSVVEVMIFTVSREMIINHMAITETLIGIIAIALLFVVRKFLFVSALDKDEEGEGKSREIMPAIMKTLQNKEKEK